MRHLLKSLARLLREIRPDKEVGTKLLTCTGFIQTYSFPGDTFALYVIERLLRHTAQVGGSHSNLCQATLIEQVSLHGVNYPTVALLEVPADGFVITGQRLVGLARNALCHDLGIEDADQTIALQDVRIEEGQRFAWLHCFDPEGRLA